MSIRCGGRWPQALQEITNLLKVNQEADINEYHYVSRLREQSRSTYEI
jgi:hypothetical protein